MEVYELMSKYRQKNPHGHFFDSDTLRFFGERVSEMRVLKGTVKKTDIDGEQHECYILSTLQRKHPIRPTRVYHYFDSITFNQVIM